MEANYLHVYGPGAWHDPAYIVGDRGALLAMREAIDKALNLQAGVTTVFNNDGEGYGLYVLLAEGKTMQEVALPYSEELARNDNGIHPHDLIST